MARMISYAQNFEDVILNRVFRGKRDGFYIDVGAMDPVKGSVTKYFYGQGWRGVNIEPVPRFHKALVRGRPRDINLAVALGRSRDTLELYNFHLAGVSTFSPEFAAHFVQRGYSCTKKPIQVLTLKDVCEEHCRGPIDFMKIDVEGWEKEVLEGGDWQRFRPLVLLIEATKPESNQPLWDDWEPFLLERGYVFAYFDGLNRFYVPKEDAGVLDHFRLPPNVMDDFETYELFRLKIIPRAVMSVLQISAFLWRGPFRWLARRNRREVTGPFPPSPSKVIRRAFVPAKASLRTYQPREETLEAAALLNRIGDVVRNRWLMGSPVPPPQAIWAGGEDEFRPQEMFPWRSVPLLPVGGRRWFWFRKLFSNLAGNGEMFSSRICHRLFPGAESKVESLPPLFLAGLGVAAGAYRLICSRLTRRLRSSVRVRSWVVMVLTRFRRNN